MRRLMSGLLCLVVILYCLTGCVNVEIGIKLNGGTRGVYTERVGVSKETLGELGYSIDTLYKDSLESLNLDGVSLSDINYTYKGTEYEGKEIKLSFSSYEDLQNKLNKLYKASENEVKNENDNVNNILSGISEKSGILTINLPKDIFISTGLQNGKNEVKNDEINAIFSIDIGSNKLIESNADEVEGTVHSWNLLNRDEGIHLKYKKCFNTSTKVFIGILIFILCFLICMRVATISKERQALKVDSNEKISDMNSESESESDSEKE
mgnify:FL=1